MISAVGRDFKSFLLDTPCAANRNLATTPNSKCLACGYPKANCEHKHCQLSSHDCLPVPWNPSPCKRLVCALPMQPIRTTDSWDFCQCHGRINHSAAEGQLTWTGTLCLESMSATSWIGALRLVQASIHVLWGMGACLLWPLALALE